MKRKDIISRKEAAEILGVNKQTISNYIARGVFDQIMIDKNVYITRKSFEENLSKLKVVQAKQNALDEIAKELDDTEREYKSHIKRIRQNIVGEKCSIDLFVKCMVSIASFVNDIRPDAFFQRDMSIFKDYLTMHPKDVVLIEKEYGLSRERVHQIIRSVARKIEGFVREYGFDDSGSYSDMVERCFRQHRHINHLSNELSKCKEALNDANKVLESFRYKSSYEAEEFVCCRNIKRAKVLDTNVADMGFSIRALNCLKNMEINSVEELIKYTRYDLYKIRNMGKKTVSEIYDVLEPYGLRLGMTNSDITEYLKG